MRSQAGPARSEGAAHAGARPGDDEFRDLHRADRRALAEVFVADEQGETAAVRHTLMLANAPHRVALTPESGHGESGELDLCGLG